MSEKKKHPGGRPSKYDKVLYPLLGYWVGRAGLIDRDVAKVFNITESTLNKWKKDYPEFSESLKKGKDTPDDQVESALLKKALGYEYQGKYYPPDTTAMIFWLKNRRSAQWRDKQELQHSGDMSLNITINHIKSDES